MKDYETMARDVLARRDQYAAAKRRQRTQLTAGASCVCLAALIGAGVWRAGMIPRVSDSDSGNGQLLDGDPSGYSTQEETAIGGALAMTDSEDGETDPLSDALPMISAFGASKTVEDLSVDNGGVVFSDGLTGALERYGADAQYRVIVELFSDGVEIDCAGESGKAEMDRFAAEGYTVAFETYYDGYVDHNYFTLHATAEQLENFPASERYGYLVTLYSERLGGDAEAETGFALGGSGN
jgi:hypothetical protein